MSLEVVKEIVNCWDKTKNNYIFKCDEKYSYVLIDPKLNICFFDVFDSSEEAAKEMKKVQKDYSSGQWLVPNNKYIKDDLKILDYNIKEEIIENFKSEIQLVDSVDENNIEDDIEDEDDIDDDIEDEDNIGDNDIEDEDIKDEGIECIKYYKTQDGQTWKSIEDARKHKEKLVKCAKLLEAIDNYSGKSIPKEVIKNLIFTKLE